MFHSIRVFSLLLLSIGFAHSLQAQCVSAFTDSVSNLTVYFTNQATGGYNAIYYDYGDGNWDINVPNPTHVYASAGVYEACQWIEDTNSFTCFDSSCDTLYLGGATCSADMYAWPDDLDLEAYGYALGQFDSIVWDFGDGNTVNDTNYVHTYADTGTYTVCFSLYSNGTLCDSACQTVIIDTSGGGGGGCEADFGYTTNDLEVSFANYSTGGYDEVFWDFGDNIGFSNDVHPTYEYLIAGTYEVCLSVYDTTTFQCYDEFCEDITVTSGGGGGGGCEAKFTYEKEELFVEMTNISSGTYLTAFYDYGDGSNPTTDTEHLYDEPGTYEVCLTIGGFIPFCFDTYCEEIVVTEFTCEPSFEYSFNESNVYSFTNTTAVGNVTSVKWTFGDGNSTTFNNPSYTYNAPGSYEVCLFTFDGENLCGETCKDLDVYALGVEDGFSAETLQVYPNPTNGKLFVALSSGTSQPISIELTDVSGRLVERRLLNTVNGKAEIDLNVPSGFYFLNASTSEYDYPAIKISVQ